MDVRNLEVLRKLQEHLSKEEKPALPEKNASGFSEASEAAFREIARRNIAAGNLTPNPKKRPKNASSSPPSRQPPNPREPIPQTPLKTPDTKKKKPKDTRPAVWSQKSCRFCKIEFRVNLNWSFLPVMCSGCRSERKVKIGRRGKSTPSIYTNIQVFSGGSPGSGKRR